MSLPLVRLHTLDPIRGFVAVGRHMSITRAAEELCVTQSAVSRQVRALEEMVGCKLLQRGHRSIALTPAGERLFRTADVAVQQLQDVIAAVSGRSEAKPVTITASIGVAGLWLIPRLASLYRAVPNVDVRVAASDRLIDLRDGGIDIAIRYAERVASPHDAVRLFGETLVPVAHPSLGLASAAPAEVIKRQVLLEFDDARRPWLQWRARLEALGLASAKPRRLLRFNQYDQVIHAAVAGQGVALGRRALVDPMLRDGRLEALRWPGDALPIPHGYWLLVAEADPRDDVARVVQWIRDESAAMA